MIDWRLIALWAIFSLGGGMLISLFSSATTSAWNLLRGNRQRLEELIVELAEAQAAYEQVKSRKDLDDEW